MKIDSIQALRGLGFIFIFLTHCSITPLFAAMAVSMFLVLSGFLLASKHYSNDEMCQWGIVDSFLYAKKKIENLYPLHIITMVLAVGIYIRYRKPWEEIVTNIILNVLLVQAWIPKQMYYFSLNGVSWYLSVCVFCYFIFPFVLKVMKKSGGGYKVVNGYGYNHIYKSIIYSFAGEKQFANGGFYRGNIYIAVI